MKQTAATRTCCHRHISVPAAFLLSLLLQYLTVSIDRFYTTANLNMAEVCKDPKEASEASVSENQEPESGHSAGAETDRVKSEGGAEVEEGELSTETQRKVMELLCDEAHFLMDDKLLTLLAPLEKEKQTVVKMDSLLCTLGLGEQDVPRLAHFLLKYERQQREQTEDVSAELGVVETRSATHPTSGLIAPNHVVPALKSFLQQHRRSKESAARQHRIFHVAGRHTSESKAYWKSMGNIIYESKVKLWDDAD
ncbi:dynein regulatory complex protein 1-like [Epinephelus fuscoguttatus]|uniref:dynein regulatory complex protein 1-like n=1 Tax=Epinephelus fuscoguttatus TaxID=293821 RepID=UPI0020D15101|nr:dynein regulatory complex protein 1-like [Epinephelus fuscoguttatus]